MNIKNSILSSILSLLVASSGLGQTPAPAKHEGGKTEEEKAEKKALEKKALALIDETLKEAANLRLPENRIRLQAAAADVLWSHDQKRARALFKQAMDTLGDLIAELNGPKSSRMTKQTWDYQAFVQVRTTLRVEILQMITRRDARLAREFLRGTRQPAAGSASQERNDQEVHLELGLAQQIAATDPTQALQIAEESLNSGLLKEELIGIVQQLATKDRDAAAKLIADVMKKLRTANFSSDRTACNLASALLITVMNSVEGEGGSDGTGGGASQILDDRTLRELADMVGAAALATLSSGRLVSGEDGYIVSDDSDEFESLMPWLEKYAPSRAAALKKKLSGVTLAPELKAQKEREALVQANDMDGLKEAAAKAAPEERDSLWIAAGMKAAAEGDTDRARQILIEHCSDSNQREQVLNQIDNQEVFRATEAGRLDEVRQLLSQAPIEQRVVALTQFAWNASQKGDKKAAVQMLEEARGLIGTQAANGPELNALLQIAATYATVEPARAFEIVEAAVDHLNALLAAASVLDGFDFGRYFKDGEIFREQSQLLSLVSQFTAETGMLARGDFDRARALADKFQLTDVRLRARLAVAQGVLSDNPSAGSMSIGRRFFTQSSIVD